MVADSAYLNSPPVLRGKQVVAGRQDNPWHTPHWLLYQPAMGFSVSRVIRVGTGPQLKLLLCNPASSERMKLFYNRRAKGTPAGVRPPPDVQSVSPWRKLLRAFGSSRMGLYPGLNERSN